jgi:hypothetical protein
VQRTLKCSAVFTVAVFSLAVTLGTKAQNQPKLQVGPLGGITEPLPRLKVPANLRRFVPSSAFLRMMLKTSMTHEGETILLYDDGKETESEVVLVAIQNGISSTLFRKAIVGVAGLQPFTLEGVQQALGFAYHTAGDGSDTQFVIYAERDGKYQSVFKHQTEQGQIRITTSGTTHVELWTADGESCVWCEARYIFKEYDWEYGAFHLKSTHRTRRLLNPADVASRPFILLSIQMKTGATE